MRRDTLAPVVERAVASVSKMPAGEVIVVPNGPTEGRRPLRFRSERLRVIESPRAGAPAARNLGLREARNDIVIFTDDDCLTSPEWAEALTSRLRADAAVATTLIDVRREGPVTAFLDYQRVFHARPADSQTADFALGACIGARRDRIAISFDEEIDGGGDAQFGMRLREAGVSTEVLDDAPPLIHLMPERIETISDRFRRYGIIGGVLLLRRNLSQFSIPSATALYASLCRNELETPRRFEELADQQVREHFAAYDLIVLATTLIGYLDAAGRELGTEIVRVNVDALESEWGGIDERLRDQFRWGGDWDRLPIDLERWYLPRETTMPVYAAEIAQNLASNAELVGELDLADDRTEARIKERADANWAVGNGILGDLRAGRLAPDIDALDARLRPAGIPFREGMQTIETIALGPVVQSAEAV
jgi:glycosyltransferase involved in cell wall biosynthesis